MTTGRYAVVAAVLSCRAGSSEKAHDECELHPVCVLDSLGLRILVLCYGVRWKPHG